MWGLQLVAMYYLPLAMPVLVGIVWLVRRAREQSGPSPAIGRLRASPVLVASAFGLWAGAVGTAATALAMIALAFHGIRVVDRPFNLPVRLPLIDSFYPSHPSPLVLLAMLLIAVVGLALGATALRQGGVLPEGAARAYLIRVLVPVRTIMIATVVVAVLWGLAAALD